MNKPIHPPVADHDVGPLDESGQQIWSAEEEAAIARLHRDPEYLAGINEAETDIVAGRVRSHSEHLIWMAQQKRRWRAERGL
jgi:hypothetical protein